MEAKRSVADRVRFQVAGFVDDVDVRDWVPPAAQEVERVDLRRRRPVLVRRRSRDLSD